MKSKVIQEEAGKEECLICKDLTAQRLSCGHLCRHSCSMLCFAWEGNLELMIKYKDEYPNAPISCNVMFWASRNGHFDAVKWLFANTDTYDIIKCYGIASNFGSRIIASWLSDRVHDLFKLDPYDFIFSRGQRYCHCCQLNFKNYAKAYAHIRTPRFVQKHREFCKE